MPVQSGLGAGGAAPAQVPVLAVTPLPGAASSPGEGAWASVRPTQVQIPTRSPGNLKQAPWRLQASTCSLQSGVTTVSPVP